MLAACRAHQASDAGTARSYSDEATRCRKAMVQAKSGTSLERATSSSR